MTDDYTPQQANQAIRSGALLVDVREKEEWDAGHMPDAVWIPMGEIAARIAELPRDRDIIFSCRSGRRSGEIKTYMMEEHGYDRVHNLLGGILAWATADLPVIK
jgi:rhodanese-related sulfurtransferase